MQTAREISRMLDKYGLEDRWDPWCFRRRYRATTGIRPAEITYEEAEDLSPGALEALILERLRSTGIPQHEWIVNP